MTRMRRRIRSAALPVHRHSLPQLAVDGLLVALAWDLAFKLRFDRGVPSRYEDLFESTIGVVVGGALVIFALSGLYQKWWRYFGRRDYETVLRGVLLLTIALAAYIATVHPVKLTPRVGAEVAVSAPAGVIVLFFLLSLAFICGDRLLV